LPRIFLLNGFHSLLPPRSAAYPYTNAGIKFRRQRIASRTSSYDIQLILQHYIDYRNIFLTTCQVRTRRFDLEVFPVREPFSSRLCRGFANRRRTTKLFRLAFKIVTEYLGETVLLMETATPVVSHAGALGCLADRFVLRLFRFR
jgi:hypothetical protein